MPSGGHTSAGTPRTIEVRGSFLAPFRPQTLVTWGRDDRGVPVDGGLRLTWGLQDAEMHIFSCWGHWAQSKYADKFQPPGDRLLRR